MFPIACCPRGRGRDMVGEIDAWQSQAIPVHAGGIPIASWANTSSATGSYTSIMPSWAILRPGTIMRIKVRIQTDNGATWGFRLFRWNGGTSLYDYVGGQNFVPGGTGDITVDISPGISVLPGDIPGIYIPASCAARASNLSTLKSRNAAGDITASGAFAGAGNNNVDLDVYMYRPYLAATGDSIAEGHNNGGSTSVNSWHSIQHGIAELHSVPGGLSTSEIWSRIRNRIPNLEYVNQGKGGQTYSWVASTGAPAALASLPHTLIVYCLGNDIGAARTWADIQANLDTILAACIAVGTRLILCEGMPWNTSTDEQAATIREYNGYLVTWGSANNVSVVRCHDEMGQVRAATGEKDDLVAAYNFDGVHLTTSGVDKMAEIIARYL